jgi:DNA-binding GntR family transcriptional regulator
MFEGHPVRESALTAFGNGGGSFSAAEWAFRELWQKIVRRELKPGERVTEETLADLLQVSRTPLRDAIRRLEQANLIIRQRNRTLNIAPMSIRDAEELTLIREQLEALIAILAARNSHHMRDQIAEAWKIINAMKSLQGTRHGYAVTLELGDAFHSALCDISGAEQVRSLLGRVYLGIERYRTLLNERIDRTEELTREHEAILIAIDAGDERRAEAAMRFHISHARELYIEELRRKMRTSFGS